MGENNAGDVGPAGCTLHEVELAKCGYDYEVGTLLSIDGTLIKEYIGGAHTVRPPEADRPLFEGCIFTHNHPSGRCFTWEDIAQFVETGLHEVRVSTPQGTFFSLREGMAEVNRSIAHVMREEKVGSLLEVDRILRRRGAELFGEAREQMIYAIMGEEVDKWLMNNAEEFGYIYIKGAL